MPVSISYVSQDDRLVELVLDASPSETHQHAAQATEFPVESGAVISDHVLQKPDVLRIEGIVTNTPLPSAMGWDVEAFFSGGFSGTFGSRSGNAYWQLLGIKESGQPVTVRTDLRSYDNMVMESFETTRDVDASEVLAFTATFKKVTTVTTRVVPVPKLDKAKAKVNKGRQPTRPADAPTSGKADSMMKRIFKPSGP